MSTLTGTDRSCHPVAVSTSPEIPEPPIPQTAMLAIDAPDTAPRSTEEAADSASVNCSGSEATASAKPSVSTTVMA